MTKLLITGTDTNVGKTVLTTSIVASSLLNLPKATVGLMKLMQTGYGDRQLYQQLFSQYSQVEIVTPLEFSTPIAPPLAAEIEGKEIDLGLVWQNFSQLLETKDLVILEGIGGLGTPITYELTVADLARDWRLPTILVVPVKLGAIAQAVANVMFARYTQVQLKGIVLSCITPDAATELENLAPIPLIESLTGIPVVGVIPYLADAQDFNTLAELGDWEF